MPRNSNGTYTLPAGNPVVSGEVISTSWANPTMEDLANEITNSLDRSGRGGMQAPFKNYDGTQSSPGITWGNEPTTGFWRNGAQDMRVSVGGQPRMRWAAADVSLWDGTIWSPVVTNSTLETNLAAKGYAQKAVNETISGAWTFSASTLTIGDQLVSTGGSYGILRRADDTTRLLLVGGLNTTLGGNARIDLNSSGYSSSPGAIVLTPATGANIVAGGSLVLNSGFGLTLQGGNLSVTGSGTFSTTLLVNGSLTAANTVNVGQAATTAEMAVKYKNAAFPDGIDMMLNSGGTAFGAFRRDTNVWLWQYTPSTSLHTLRTDVSVTGTLNAVVGLQVNGTAVALSTTTITGANSVTGGGSLAANRTLSLVNDVASPGSSWYYGTDAAGAKGWFPLSGVVGVPEAPVDGNAYARQNASWVNIGTGGVYVLKTGDTMSGALTIAANSRGLKLYNTAPAITFQDTDATVDQRTFDIIQNANTLQFRTLVDSLSTAKNALVFTGRTDTNGIANIILGNTTDYPPLYAYSTQLFVGNNSVTPVATSTRQVGLYGTSGHIEVGLYMNDGTYNPRTALFGESAGKVGLDWVFSSAVDRFEFRRAGTEIFSYNQLGPKTTNLNWNANTTGGTAVGLNLYRADVQRWLVGMETDAGTNNFRIWRYNASGVYQGVAFDISAGDGTVAINGPLAASTTFSVAGAATFNGTTRVNNAGTFSTAFSAYRDTSVAQGVKLFSDSALNSIVGCSATGNAKGLLLHATTDELNTTPTAGSCQMQFKILGSLMMNITTFIDFKKDARFSDNGKLYFYDAVNTAYAGLGLNSTGKRIFYNDAGTAKGAMWHWDSSGLQWGNILISTSDPATTGNPGTIVLVYE